MASSLRHSTVGRYLSVYRYVEINLPKTTTAVADTLLLGNAAVHLYLVITAAFPTYVAACLLLLVLGFLTAVVLTVVPDRRPARCGWLLGAATSVLAGGGYLLSRFVALPGMPYTPSWWDFPPGSLVAGCAALYLVLYASVLLGMNTAFPDTARWRD